MPCFCGFFFNYNLTLTQRNIVKALREACFITSAPELHSSNTCTHPFFPASHTFYYPQLHIPFIHFLPLICLSTFYFCWSLMTDLSLSVNLLSLLSFSLSYMHICHLSFGFPNLLLGLIRINDGKKIWGSVFNLSGARCMIWCEISTRLCPCTECVMCKQTCDFEELTFIICLYTAQHLPHRAWINLQTLHQSDFSHKHSQASIPPSCTKTHTHTYWNKQTHVQYTLEQSLAGLRPIHN